MVLACRSTVCPSGPTAKLRNLFSASRGLTTVSRPSTGRPLIRTLHPDRSFHPGRRFSRRVKAVRPAGVLPAVHGGLAVETLELLELAADEVHRLLGELARLLGDHAVAPEIVLVRAVREIGVAERGEIEIEIAVAFPSQVLQAGSRQFKADKAAVVERKDQGRWRQPRSHGLPDASPHDSEIPARRIVVAELDVVALHPAGVIGDVLRLQQRAGRPPDPPAEAAGGLIVNSYEPEAVGVLPDVGDQCPGIRRPAARHVDPVPGQRAAVRAQPAAEHFGEVQPPCGTPSHAARPRSRTCPRLGGGNTARRRRTPRPR